jgi:hypothetical protein
MSKKEDGKFTFSSSEDAEEATRMMHESNNELKKWRDKRFSQIDKKLDILWRISVQIFYVNSGAYGNVVINGRTAKAINEEMKNTITEAREMLIIKTKR